MLRRVRRILFLAIGIPLGIAFVAAAAFVGYVFYLSSQTPSIDDLKPRPEAQNSVVYAASGERLGFIPAAQLRQEVRSSSIPAFMKQAIVAVEDRRFYQHKGIDYPGILRAAAKDLTSQAVVQGGSTITMQLVRRLYLTRERNFKRKIEEATLAREMEQRRSKDWILTNYLNDISFGTVGGQEAVGVQAAARVFFGKPAKSLNLSESALLAGLPQEPTLYNPVRHPEAARARRSEVLHAMVASGMISQAVADRIDARGLGLHLNHYYTQRRERHFFDYVERELRQRLGAAVVDRGGLRVHTTLDIPLQQAARAAIRRRLGQPHDPASAIVSIDVHNGDIRTMATTTKYDKEQFDYASQGHRQPGSTFKPIVLMAAIAGHSADPRKTYYVSKPLDVITGFGRVKVETYDHTYGGRMNLVKATLRSDNSVFQQLDLDVGPDLVADTAANLGIDTPLDGYPAEGLGGLHTGVTPLELARAYATFASGGKRLDISAIRQVDFVDGRPSVRLDDPGSDSLFKDGETYEVTKILQQNMKHGTGQAAQMGCPAAGKTGTTDKFRDAWFAGYTPRLSTVVWVGYPDRAISMTNVHGIKVAGATFPAQLWHDYMAVAKGGFCGTFPKPSERPDLHPYCARMTATQHCAPPPVDANAAPSGTDPAQAAGGSPQSTTTAPAPVPVPDTVILGAPPPTTTARGAIFKFASQGAGSTGFECQVDARALSPCTSPADFRGLRPGHHIFTVRALSAAGAPGSPATYTWTVFDDLVPSSPQAESTQPQPAPQPQPQPKPKPIPQNPPQIVG
jgi:penicillin-binding protein 1A